MTTFPFVPVAPVTPRRASTTLIVRDGASGLQVLMVRRSLQASFMPGAYVFPGGAVDGADGDAASAAACDERTSAIVQRIGAVTGAGDSAPAHAVAALRECFEECGLWLGTQVAFDRDAMRRRLQAGEPVAAVAAAAGLRLHTSALHPWSRWVTPVGLPKRFDTLFFVAPAPAGQVPEVDAGETTTLAWVDPRGALAAYAGGEFPMEFATRSTVESLQPFAAAGVSALLACAAMQTTVPAVHPRLELDGNGRVVGVLLPGQAGYEKGLGAT